MSLLAVGLALSLVGCGSSDASTGVLRILVSNDDGVRAEGIDAIVEALIADENNEVTVSAPLENKSGSGDSTIATSPSCGTGNVTMEETASGYPATAVDGCPADAVNYGLANLYPADPPHVVVSGINDGQNVGDVGGALSKLSGTIGAAKTAGCRGVPAVAASQGEGDTVDFPAGVDEVLMWLRDNRAALIAGSVTTDTVDSINIPSCDTGSIRGRVEVPLATTNPDSIPLLGTQDCESTLQQPTNDIEGFFNGYVTITEISVESTCPMQ